LKKIIFATGNKGKAEEVKKLFASDQIEILTLHDLMDVPEIIEDADTFEENALIKALTIRDKYNLPVFADDSGLQVQQLNGAPGVYSARYAGENCTFDDNNRKLIEELKSFDSPHLARFICCAVYVTKENTVVAFGELRGEIIDVFKGTKGFGYDPIFKPENSDRTLAEYSMVEKNLISHRGKAFTELKKKIIF